jgi:serine/threonine protein kinase
MGESAVRERIQAKSGWLLQKQLGRGQYGTAYLVNGGNKENEEDTAVAKVVGLEFLPEKEHKIAFQEVDLMRKLRHAHIVSLVTHFFTEANLELVIIMEYCDQGDLRGEVKKRAQVKPIDRIEENTIMLWFVQLTLALNYIHQHHILHRDLKSSNIFMTTNADKSGLDVKIGDFGISRVLEGTVDVAATVVGTPYYMSPEVCKAEPYGYKSDIWALGCVLYEMCMLKHAFESQSLLGLVYKIVSETYDPIPPVYCKDLGQLMERVLNKSAYHRPSGKELLADPYVRKFVPTALAGEVQGGVPVVAPTEPAEVEVTPVKSTTSATSAPGQPKKAIVPQRTSFNPAAKKANGPPRTNTGSMRIPEATPPQPDVNQPAKQGAFGNNPPEEVHQQRRWAAPPGAAQTPVKPLDEGELRSQVLLGRIKRALAVRRQNWLQVFASFDHVGDGRLPEAEFDRAVTSMALGLSDQEIREVRRYLLTLSGGTCVPVDLFGTAITGTSQAVQGAEAWGRATLTELSREATKASGSSNSVAPGAAVRVQGLQSAVGVKLNGCEGIVKEWDSASCRWVVRLEKGELKSIRDEHLHLVRPAPGGAPGGVDGGTGCDTTALYRVLCEGGETVPEASFLASVQRMLPKLTEAERRKLLLLLPKSADGSIDVPEVLAQFFVGNVGDQTMLQTMGRPLISGPSPAPTGGQVGPGPGYRPQSSPNRGPVIQGSMARPSPPQRHAPGLGPSPPSATRGQAPNSVPGSVPSPRSDPISPTKASQHQQKTFGRGGNEGAPSEGDRVHAEVALLRLSQKLLGRPAAPGPGADLLRLFASRPNEVRVDELCEAVSVSPLGISRAEVQGVFSHLTMGNGSSDTLPLAHLTAALEHAYNAGPPSEAASLEGINLSRLTTALQRLDSAGGGGGRNTIQEFRVTLMQAEPYLTKNQLEWLMLLTDQDGEGRLLPRSLLVRLGAGPSNPNRSGQLVVPPRPACVSRTPIAPHSPRSIVVAAILQRLRDRLCAAGPQLTLEQVLSVFDMGTDRGITLSRDTLACLLGHMRLGISVAEADEVVSSIAGGSAVGGGSVSVKLASLYEAVRRAGEPESDTLVDELREVAHRFLGRGNQFAQAAQAISEGGEWIQESEFRRCLAVALMDEGVQAKAPDVEEEDKVVLLAEKSAAGAVRWRHFATTLGWADVVDDYQIQAASPSHDELGGQMHHSWRHGWRSNKTDQKIVPGRTVPSPQRDMDQFRPPDSKARSGTEPAEKQGGPCRCLSRLFGGQA